MSTIKVNKIENTSTADGGVAIDTDGHITIDGQQFPTAGPLSNRNLIVNGAMQVAQRSTLVEDQTAGGYFTVDRMGHSETGATGYTFDQEQSTDAPTGFAYSFKNTTATALTATADSEIRALRYKIEGQDLQHLNYGTANAQTITLSFWVKTSVQGTYVVRFMNNDDTQSRRFAGQYTIASDETGAWQYRTITVVGDTNTAIANSNENEFDIFFVTDAGSNRTGGTANQWDDFATGTAAPGQTAFVGRTVSESWQITGIQLEVGSKSTPFEHKSYGDELARCQRYLFRVNRDPNTTDEMAIGTGHVRDSDTCQIYVPLPVQMRANGQSVSEAHLDIISGADNNNASMTSSFDEANSMVGMNIDADSGTPWTTGRGAVCRVRNVAGAFFQVESEL